jgi:hypothetical protein
MADSKLNPAIRSRGPGRTKVTSYADDIRTLANRPATGTGGKRVHLPSMGEDLKRAVKKKK